MKYMLFLFLICSIVSCTSDSGKEKSEEKPNILLIITDDQGWGDMSSHGNPHLETPGLDQLAAQGREYMNFYVDPVCAPSRAALLTGRFSYRTGTIGVSRGLEDMDPEEITIAQLLQKEGYRTGCFGKWHNGRTFATHPNQQGFDTFFGFRTGGIGNYFDPVLESNSKKVTTKGFVTDILTDQAIQFIEKNKNRPFFCYIPYNAPHTPFQVPDTYFDKYKKKDLSDDVAALYGMIENIDDNVLKLLNTLKKNNLENNTIVIFLSDNGPICCRYNAGLKGNKGSVNEGGVKVPFIIKWPEHLKKGEKIDHIAAHVDVFPTLLNMVGADIPSLLNLDGMDLMKVKDESDRTIPVIEALSYSELSNLEEKVSMSIRTPMYRYVANESGKNELYNLNNDPQQKTNVAGQNPEIASKLENRTHDILSEIEESNLGIRPILIGQQQASYHELFADRAEFTGNIEFFKGFGYNSDWITSWNSLEDIVWWDIKALRTETYDVYIKYTCEEQNVGSKIKVTSNNTQITGTINKAYDPPFIDVPDRVEAKGKSSLRKTWDTLSLGTLTIKKGSDQLLLQAIDIENESVCDVRSIILRKQ